MLAVKHFDPVMGVDIHIVTIPPVGPVPIPHPHISMVLDPMDYVPIMGATVLVGGVPRGTAGTAGKPVPHIPMGGPFVKPPGNEDEIFMGSATVLAEDTPFSFTALPVLSCQDIGMPAPFRTKKPRKSYGMVLPTSVVIAVPAGMPVLVGGPPTVDMQGIADALKMAVLGKAAKKLRGVMKKSKKMKKISKAIHKKAKKAMDKLGVPPNARNKVHKSICTVTGHPVDVATGKMFTDNIDFELPGPIPLVWERTWYSTSTYEGPLGHGWHHNYDMALSEIDGAVAVRLADGRPCVFPALKPGEQSFSRADKLTLIRDEYGYALDNEEGYRYRFTPLEKDVQWQVLREIIDKPKRAKIRFAYSKLGHLVQIKDGAGRIISLDNDSEGRIQRIFLPHPENHSEVFCANVFEYQHGNLAKVSDTFGRHMEYHYKNNLIVQEKNRNGFSFYFEYDADDNSANCTRTWGDQGLYDHTITYQTAKNVTLVKNSLGHTSTVYHNGTLACKIIDALGNETSTEYNEFLDVICEIDELGRATKYEFDDRGNPTKIMNPDGSELSMTYDHNDDLVMLVDAVGGEWRWEYDDSGREISLTDPLGLITKQEYVGTSIQKSFYPDGSHTVFKFNDCQLLQGILHQDGSATQLKYDGLGRCVSEVDPNGNVFRLEYDLAGNLVEVQEPDGNIRNFYYDAEANIVRAADKLTETIYEYGGFGVVQSISENGNKISFEYDTEENLIAVVNEQKCRHEFSLDANGEVIREVFFNGREKRYARDAAGQVLSIESAGRVISRFTYDILGRVTEILYGDNFKEQFKYRQDGELIEATNNAISTCFTLDIKGQILKETQGDHWIKYTYDGMGRTISLRSSKGAVQNIERSADGFAKMAYQGKAKHKTTFSRDNLGFELQRALPSGANSRWKRDKLGRPVEHRIETKSASATTRHYEWGLADKLKKYSKHLKQTTEFSYDGSGKLISARYANGEFDVRIPDTVGNFFGKQSRDDRAYGKNGELLWLSEGKRLTRFAYDDIGNLAKKIDSDGREWTYLWNLAGQLVKVTRPDGRVVCFFYDALGRRIEKNYNGRKTRWLWDGDNPLHEWVESLTPQSDIVAAAPSKEVEGDRRAEVLQPIQAQAPPDDAAPEQPVKTWWFEPDTYSPMGLEVGEDYYSILSDHVGAPFDMINSKGESVWSADIDLWGQLTNVVGDTFTCPFRWAGQYADQETGLYFNRFRYYDPQIGQYISQDPIGLSGGLNLYAYVHDPNSWVDPLGLAKKKCGAPGSQRWKGKKTKAGKPYKKPGPKTNPNAPHNKKINEIIKKEKAKGKIHIGGGSKTEITVATPGGKKPYRRMDASFKDPKTGKIEHHNVGKSNRSRGDPIKRERDAISDVETKGPAKDRDITFHSYGTT